MKKLKKEDDKTHTFLKC